MMLDRWSWWATETADNPIGVIGYLYMAQDAWRWPLTQTVLLNPPTGLNTFYTDMVPAGALIGKIVQRLTGETYLYFGKWILLAYGMQALIGWLIFRNAGIGRLMSLIGASFFLLTPSFLARLGHIGLVAHWVVLLSILSYMRVTAAARRKEMFLWAVVIGSVAGINPYLAAMCSAVYLAGVLETARRGHATKRDVLIALALLMATIMAWAAALGIIGQGSLPRDNGFGKYSMNLLSPLMPQVSAIPGFSGLIDATGGQYEGFNYFGAGVLLIALIVITVRLRDVIDLVKSNPILSILLLGLAVYAISDKIYVGKWLLVDLGYGNWPGIRMATSVLRSSGRFFWPVAYCGVIALVIIVARRMPQRTALAVLAFGAVIQVADIRPLLAVMQGVTRVKPPLIDRQAFMEAARVFDEFAIYPPAHCIPMGDRDVTVQLQLISAQARIPSSGAFSNRGGSSCNDAAKRFSNNIAADTIAANPLVIVLKAGWQPMLHTTAATGGFACREAARLFACSRDSNNPTFVALGAPLSPTILPMGADLPVRRGGAGEKFLGIGWSVADESVRWAMGPETSVGGPLEKPICSSLIFRARTLPLSFRGYFVESARVTLNGQDAGVITLQDPSERTVEHRIDLNGKCVESVNLALHFAGLKTPADLGMNSDTRPLSWLFRWFAINEIPR